jgi:hypothetical protein
MLDERRGRIEPVGGDYVIVLQYLRASSSDSDTKAVRYEGQVPVDGMDADFYSDFNTDSWCTLFLASQLVDNFVSCRRSEVSASHGDVLTFDDDTIATVQR